MTARDGPQDRYKAVWLIFFILGLGTLLPWNFFMNAREYFINRLADLRNETGEAALPLSYLQSMFDNFMTLCSMVPLLIFTCLNSFIHQRISQQIRILGSLMAIGIVFLVTAIMVKVPMEPLPFFIFTMISIIFINSFGAILQSSLFGLAGLLPASYTAPIMSGQGLAGTFAALAMIFSIAIGAQQPESFIGYFTTACVAILLAIFSYMLLPRMDFFRYYSMKDKTEYRVYNAELETKRDLIKKADEPNGMEQNNSKIIPIHNPDEKPSVVAIFKKLWVMAVSVCVVFTVTIGVFPSITAKVSTVLGEGNRWGLYFLPVSCFLLFNVFDWTGRSLTALFTWPGKDSCLLPVMVALRVIFIPLFMLCNVQPRDYLPVIFSHDAWYIIFMIFFSISNGYLASLCMCFGPKKVLAHEAETAGAIMTFFLSLGLALGAAISFLFRILI
ncbi:S29A1 protein, partial [Nyctiprogne leucopyga]|nr:S29A1 protein [Nyctiprogne leucopyga]